MLNCSFINLIEFHSSAGFLIESMVHMNNIFKNLAGVVIMYISGLARVNFIGTSPGPPGTAFVVNFHVVFSNRQVIKEDRGLVIISVVNGN